MTMRRVLLLFAHPTLEKSHVNVHLVDAVRDVDGVTFHDLYEAYPDFFIDVPREQELLRTHDVIVMHHPFFWYSSPALVKQWEDLVLQHGWAYGTGGTALAGKWWMTAITTGGRAVAYRRDGYNHFTIRELMTPLEQTARLCRMQYLAPFVVHGTLGMSQQQIAEHAADYRRLLIALRDDALDLDRARTAERINENLDAVIRRTVES